MNTISLPLTKGNVSFASRIFGLLLMVSSLLFSPVGLCKGLPVEIELDRYMMAAAKNLQENRLKKVEHYLKKIEALEVDPPALYHYYKAQTFRSKGELKREKNHLESYVSLAGKDGEHYESSLVRITQLEEASFSKGGKDSGQSESAAILDAFKQDKDAVNQKHADKLKTLYLKDSYNQALVAHINALLATHTYTGKRFHNSGTDAALTYKVSIANEDTIVVLRRDRTTSPEQLTRDKFVVYGQNSSLTHECHYQSTRCTINHPDNYREWLVLGYDKSAAKEVASSMSLLIRNLQSGKDY